MSSAPFLSTFGLVFLAEIGDKTQLAAMTLAARYPWKPVFGGVAAAFAVLNLCAVLVGQAAFLYLPLFWVRLASAALFLWFGIATLRGRGGGDSWSAAAGVVRRGPWSSAFFLILLAELGDKTQLATAGLAAQYDAPVAVFAGSTLALWGVSLLGILVGTRLTRRVPQQVVHRAAGALFLAFAAAALFQAVRG